MPGVMAKVQSTIWGVIVASHVINAERARVRRSASRLRGPTPIHHILPVPCRRIGLQRQCTGLSSISIWRRTTCQRTSSGSPFPDTLLKVCPSCS
jgi:hypothetical protein